MGESGNHVQYLAAAWLYGGGKAEPPPSPDPLQRPLLYRFRFWQQLRSSGSRQGHRTYWILAMAISPLHVPITPAALSSGLLHSDTHLDHHSRFQHTVGILNGNT